MTTNNRQLSKPFRKFKKPYQNEREFVIAGLRYERGMIRAWEHAKRLIENCIKAHRKEATIKRQTMLAEMNKHLIENPSTLRGQSNEVRHGERRL